MLNYFNLILSFQLWWEVADFHLHILEALLHIGELSLNIGEHQFLLCCIKKKILLDCVSMTSIFLEAEARAFVYYCSY